MRVTDFVNYVHCESARFSFIVVIMINHENGRGKLPGKCNGDLRRVITSPDTAPCCPVLPPRAPGRCLSAVTTGRGNPAPTVAMSLPGK